MMIHDYHLKLLLEPEQNDQIIPFEKWREDHKKRLGGRTKGEKHIIWQEGEVVGRKKKEIKKVFHGTEEDKKEYFDFFYPSKDNLQKLPKDSTLIKISFTLKKPYTSKDEGEFHIINGRIFENPIIRDKFLGLPMVRPSTWKGHLRFAAERVEFDNEKIREIIRRRLFGSKSGDENVLKGRLYFFPTFFKKEAEREVITPLKRDTRTPTKRGPIPLEVMKPGKNGEFHLLYIPYPREKGFKEEDVKEDLKFLAESLKLMFYTFGFSAKKTSGFGVIKALNEIDFEIYPKDKKEHFSILYTKVNKTVNHGAYK